MFRRSEPAAGAPAVRPLLALATAAALSTPPDALPGSPPAAAAPSARAEVQEAGRDTLEQLAADALNAVVLINVRTPSGSRQGSGFLVDPGGRILTNHHVVRDARSVRVKLASGDVYDRVTVLAVDDRRDVAVLQIAGFDLPSLELGNSASVSIGTPVVHIGSPLGLENTVSTGIVSGRRQEDDGYQLLQISAPASTGSSGGPVLSRAGQVVGIAASQLPAGQNLNFAVPINYARGLLDNLPPEPVAVLGPEPSADAGRDDVDLADGAVNAGLRFALDRFGGYSLEKEGPTGRDRSRRTRVTYRRIETVGGGEARIERYSESETTERTGPFQTPQTVRRTRARSVVGAGDLRPISARGEIAWWTGDAWQTAEYDLRFDGYRVRGVIRDTAGQARELDRDLPRGILLRDMRDLGFATLSTDSLLGRSVEFVTFDPLTGEVTTDRYDVRGTTSVQVAGESHEALQVNIATGLTNATAYFRGRIPRVLLRTRNEERGETEEVVELEVLPPPRAGEGGGAPDRRDRRTRTAPL